MSRINAAYWGNSVSSAAGKSRVGVRHPEKRILACCLGLAVSVASLGGAWAQAGQKGQEQASAEEAYFSEIPVVFSASRLPKPLRDVPGAMTVIDREIIKRSGARDLADILRWVPGIQMAQSTSTHSTPGMVYHGLWNGSNGAVQVLVDGRALYSPLFLNGGNFNALPVILEDVERIEVLRGPNPVAYGANAMLAVINIVTTDPSLTRGGKVAVSAGTHGVRDTYAQVGWGDEDLTQRLSVSRRYDEGVADFRDFRRMLKFDWRGDWRLSSKDELRLVAGGVKTRLGVGYPATPGINAASDERTRELSSFYAQGEWIRRLAGDDELRVSYAHTSEWLREAYLADTGIPNFFNPAPATFKLGYNLEPRSTVDNIDWQHTLRWGEDKRFFWGGGVRRDVTRSQFFLGRPDAVSSTTQRLFGYLEWRLAEAWLLNFGGAWERESLSGNTFSPRISLNYQPNKEETIRVGVSRAFRVPSIFEQRSNASANDPGWPLTAANLALFGLPAGIPLWVDYRSQGALKPEQLDNVELSYLGDFRQIGLMLDVRLFNAQIKDRVVPYRQSLPAACLQCALGGVLPVNLVNGQDMRLRGLEYQLRWKTPWSSEIWFNQTFTDLKSKNLRGVPSGQMDVIIADAEHSVPRRAESIHWMQPLPWWGANLTVSYSHRLSTQWMGNPVGSTRRLDWRLAVPFKSDWGRGEVAWTARADKGSLLEYSQGVLRYQQPTIDPRHWITLSLEF